MRKVAIISIIALIGGLIIYKFNPSLYWFMPKCPFKLITGFNCPGCGIQRAIYEMLHGNFIEAIKYNYYLLYSGPYLASFIFVWVMPDGKCRTSIKEIIENKVVVKIYIYSFAFWLIFRNIYSL